MTWAPQATPQSCDEALNEPSFPEIAKIARKRGIHSIVHFTRIRGLKGILYTSAVKARRYLHREELLKYVYEDNAPDRSRDEVWHGYVNLSVTDINHDLFVKSRKWHPSDEWVVLGFSSEILSDPGVVFCTSNNAYPLTYRSRGPEGFEQMFAPLVPWGYHGSASTRRGRPSNRTTDSQAEVLYPYELCLDHLHTITVPDPPTYDTVQAILANLDSYDPAVRIDPEAFR